MLAAVVRVALLINIVFQSRSVGSRAVQKLQFPSSSRLQLRLWLPLLPFLSWFGAAAVLAALNIVVTLHFAAAPVFDDVADGSVRYPGKHVIAGVQLPYQNIETLRFKCLLPRTMG